MTHQIHQLDAVGHRSVASGPGGRPEAARSRVHRSTPALPPVAASLPLGGAWGRFPAVAPMAPHAPAGNLVRPYGPRGRRTTRIGGSCGTILQRWPDCLLRACSQFAAQRTRPASTASGFRFQGREIQFADISTGNWWCKVMQAASRLSPPPLLRHW